MMTRAWILAAALLFLVFLTGCLSLERERPEKRHFLIQVSRGGDAPQSSPPSGVLYVRRFGVSQAFQAPSFVYRTGESSWESDYYNDFFVAPDAMLTAQCSRWFEDSGLFARVAARGSQAPPDYLLEGHVVSIYGDYRNPDRPEAVIEIQLLLLREHVGKTEIVFQGNYMEHEVVSGNSAADLVAAWNSALTSILRNAERDLGAALAESLSALP